MSVYEVNAVHYEKIVVKKQSPKSRKGVFVLPED